MAKAIAQIAEDSSSAKAVKAATITISPKLLKIASLPGLPAVYEREDDRFLALKNSIKAVGVLQEVLIDEDQFVYVGRARVLACRELGIDVPFRTIQSEDGPRLADEALTEREWDLVDTADYLAFVSKNLGKVKGAIKDLISEWVREHRGWTLDAWV